MHRRLRAFVALLLLTAAGWSAGAEPPQAASAPAEDAAAKAEAVLKAPSQGRAGQGTPDPDEKLSVWELYLSGGVLMIPITFMSLIVVMFGLERWIGLRRGKVVPTRLMRQMTELVNRPSLLDPREAYRLCNQFPSAAANVLRSVLLKVGRPHSEIEHAVGEVCDAEADKLYSNVRWLNLSASVTPLMGLLGTVQGMIYAFFVTAHMPPGAGKAAALAKGIYIALVTTFGGLTVAIPAAVLAHFFEGRIQKLFRELDGLLSEVLAHLCRYEGRVRASRDRNNQLQMETIVGPESLPVDEKSRDTSAAAPNG